MTISTGPADELAACPRCRTPAATARGATPWCPACEWNLDTFEADRRQPEFGWRWADRLTHRIAYRLSQAQFTALSARPLDRPSAGAARIITLAASVLILLGVGACAAFGAWLVGYDFPALTIVPGVTLLGMAVLLRPRLGRLNRYDQVLDPAQAPELFRLIRRVSAAVGVQPPDVVAVDADFNAYTTSVGVRRRRVLCLGLPLFLAISPQERVALLGHEMAHFANGDVRRGLLGQMTLRTLGTVADLIAPGPGNAAAGLVGILVGWFQAGAAAAVRAVHLLVVWVALRDGQRAEYQADELAAGVAGTSATARLFDTFLLDAAVTTVVRREARRAADPAAWQAAAEQAHADLSGTLPVLRQLSVRDEASLFASHPPAGLRAAMLGARDHHEPLVQLSREQARRIDDELVRHAERIRRELVWS